MTVTRIAAQRKFTTRREVTVNWWGIVSTGLYGTLTVLSVGLAIDAFLIGGILGVLVGIMYLSCGGIFVLMLIDMWSTGL